MAAMKYMKPTNLWMLFWNEFAISINLMQTYVACLMHWKRVLRSTLLYICS